jgi:hypothetical protein
MAISAVSSSTSTSTKAIEQARPPAPPKKAETPKAAESSKAPPQAQKTEQPKPVVNAQGQKTGRVVNVTA